MNQYISSEYPTLLFSTIEAAKQFAETIELQNSEGVEYIFLSNDEKETRHIGYALLTNSILLR